MKLPEDGFDLAVVNGTIIDVVRQSFAQVNLGIRDGKIAAITSSPLEAREVIDARGRYVSPGFIDFHSHVDGNAYAAECIVRQGGTTTLGGERSLNGKTIRNIAEEGFIINHGFLSPNPSPCGTRWESRVFMSRPRSGKSEPWWIWRPGLWSLVPVAFAFLWS